MSIEKGKWIKCGPCTQWSIFSHKRECSTDIHYNVGASWKHNAERKRSDTKCHIVWFHLYGMSKTDKSTETESRWVVDWAGGNREIGKWLLKGTGFLSGVMKCAKLPVMTLAHISIKQQCWRNLGDTQNHANFIFDSQVKWGQQQLVLLCMIQLGISCCQHGGYRAVDAQKIKAVKWENEQVHEHMTEVLLYVAYLMITYVSW